MGVIKNRKCKNSEQIIYKNNRINVLDNFLFADKCMYAKVQEKIPSNNDVLFTYVLLIETIIENASRTIITTTKNRNKSEKVKYKFSL